MFAPLAVSTEFVNRLAVTVAKSKLARCLERGLALESKFEREVLRAVDLQEARNWGAPELEAEEEANREEAPRVELDSALVQGARSRVGFSQLLTSTP